MRRRSLFEYLIAPIVGLLGLLFVLVVWLGVIAGGELYGWVAALMMSVVVVGFLVVYHRRIAFLVESLTAIDEQKGTKIKELDELSKAISKRQKHLQKLSEKKDRLNAKLKLKSQSQQHLLSALSHEIRNPVAAIDGYASTLIEQEDIPKNMQKNFLQKILDSSQKLVWLLERLSHLNALKNRQIELKLKPVSIEPIAKRVSKQLLWKYPQRTIVIDCDDKKLLGDEMLIETLLLNLVENALKYTDDEVRIVQKGRFVAVEDKGEGIAKKELSKITKRFYRSSRYSWNNAMGLGLSIVKAILKLHQSKLLIVSKKNRGSRFGFVLKKAS